MPKELAADLSERILRLVAASPAGISRSQIAATLGSVASSRTIARRLAELVDSRALVTRGKGPSLRYQVLEAKAESKVASPAIQGDGQGETYVPTSKESNQVRDYVRKPLAERRPVAYRREFLENYLPNRTWYLSLATRRRLLQFGRPVKEERPAGTYARDVLNRLLIDLSWASSRLEGNTYTRLETQDLIQKGKAAEGKDRRDAQMILNHKAAIEMLVENVDEVGFNRFTFMNLHANLSENLLGDPSMSGRLRTKIVEISGTVFHPLAIPQQIEDYFAMILRKADAIEDPFEQAFFSMVQLPYLQPFVDMNKRVSRLAANIPFIKKNLCPLSFIDVPEQAYVEGTLGVYELNRVELLRDVFVWAYERSAARFAAVQDSLPAPDPVRLRNRDALSVVIGDIVRSQEIPSISAVTARAERLVEEHDMPRFVEIALQELSNLHEGNIARYRLRLSEYGNWKKVTGSGND